MLIRGKSGFDVEELTKVSKQVIVKFPAFLSDLPPGEYSYGNFVDPL